MLCGIAWRNLDIVMIIINNISTNKPFKQQKRLSIDLKKNFLLLSYSGGFLLTAEPGWIRAPSVELSVTLFCYKLLGIKLHNIVV